VDQVVLRPLPVEATAELVVINAPMPCGRRAGPVTMSSRTTARGEDGEQVNLQGLNYEAVLRFRDQVKGFRDVLAFAAERATMPAGDRSLKVKALLGTGNYFRTPGAHPSFGRSLPKTPSVARPRPLSRAVVVEPPPASRTPQLACRSRRGKALPDSSAATS